MRIIGACAGAAGRDFACGFEPLGADDRQFRSRRCQFTGSAGKSGASSSFAYTAKDPANTTTTGSVTLALSPNFTAF